CLRKRYYRRGVKKCISPGIDGQESSPPLSLLCPVPLEPLPRDVRNAWPAAEDATDGCAPSSSGQSGSERYRRKPRFAGGQPPSRRADHSGTLTHVHARLPAIRCRSAEERSVPLPCCAGLRDAGRDG